MVGLPYGLGLMDASEWAGLSKGEGIGHGGLTFGFSSYSVHLPKMHLSLSVAVNTEEDSTAQYTAGVAVRILKAQNTKIPSLRVGSLSKGKLKRLTAPLKFALKKAQAAARQMRQTAEKQASTYAKQFQKSLAK